MVFPTVGSASFVCPSKAVLAVVNSPLSALSCNKAFAVANFAFSSSTLPNAKAASAWVLFSASASIAAAVCLAAVKSLLSLATSSS